MKAYTVVMHAEVFLMSMIHPHFVCYDAENLVCGPLSYIPDDRSVELAEKINSQIIMVEWETDEGGSDETVV